MKRKVKTYPLAASGATTLDLPVGSRAIAMFRDSLVVVAPPVDELESRTFLAVHFQADLPDEGVLRFVTCVHNKCLFEVFTEQQLLGVSSKQREELIILGGWI